MGTTRGSGGWHVEAADDAAVRALIVPGNLPQPAFFHALHLAHEDLRIGVPLAEQPIERRRARTQYKKDDDAPAKLLDTSTVPLYVSPSSTPTTRLRVSLATRL